MKTLPRGIRNKNPLNLIKTSTKWLGLSETQADPRFCQFKTMEWGIRAAIINIRTICKRNPACTIQKLINVWAPPFENSTQAYITRVCELTGFTPQTVIMPADFDFMCNLIDAMAIIENGKDYLTHDVVLRAFWLARGDFSTSNES